MALPLVTLIDKVYSCEFSMSYFDMIRYGINYLRFFKFILVFEL